MYFSFVSFFSSVSSLVLYSEELKYLNYPSLNRSGVILRNTSKFDISSPGGTS